MELGSSSGLFGCKPDVKSQFGEERNDNQMITPSNPTAGERRGLGRRGDGIAGEGRARKSEREQA